MSAKTPFTTLPVFYALELVYSVKHRTERKAMNTNYTPSPATIRELKRQKAFMQTIIKRSDEKHEATRTERLQKVEKLDEQIALATELEEMEVN
jgi:uncharacterized protein with WD repeat